MAFNYQTVPPCRPYLSDDTFPCVHQSAESNIIRPGSPVWGTLHYDCAADDFWSQASLEYATAFQGVKTSQTKEPCPSCNRIPRNASDAKRHMYIHTRPFICTESDCKVERGFASRNDLERHKKSVHLMMPEAGPKAWYVCPIGGFDKCMKLWPRKDNLCVHMRRQDGSDGNQDVIAVNL